LIYLFIYYKGTSQASFSKEPVIFTEGSLGLHLLPWQAMAIRDYNKVSFFFANRQKGATSLNQHKQD